jgi:lysophospholipid acyltransferase (LPLAT)-like uncharacterized protein
VNVPHPGGTDEGARRDAAAPPERTARTTRLAWHERALAAAGGVLLDGIMASCRYRMEGEQHFRRFWDRGQPVVFVLWHGRLLPSTYLYRHHGLVTLVSMHRDGEYITRAVRRWGYEVVRGSSSRGGVPALRELMQHVRAGRSLAITPDGPRGPRETMKPGPVIIAQRTGAPIVPVAAAASRCWYLGGWDRFLVPKPGATLRVACGAPVRVPRKLDPPQVQAFQDEVQRRLVALTEQVEAG